MSFVNIPIGHGRLEGLLWKAEVPKGAAVVCHPHPQQGGTMDNHVTYRMADAFRQAGMTVVRFNFRGVGGSSGAYDEGRGEVDDAEAALDYLQKEAPGVPLYAAGFSFGSHVALQLALRDERIERVLGVGMPLGLLDFSFVEELGKPKAFIHGEQDEFASVPQVRALLERLPLPRELFVLKDADHLCTGKLGELSRVLGEALAWLLTVEP
jgi:hypothetical protein